MAEMNTKYDMFWDAWERLPMLEGDVRCQEACRIVATCWEESSLEYSFNLTTYPYIGNEPEKDVCRERASADSEEKCQHDWGKKQRTGWPYATYKEFCTKCGTPKERSV